MLYIRSNTRTEMKSAEFIQRINHLVVLQHMVSLWQTDIQFAECHRFAPIGKVQFVERSSAFLYLGRISSKVQHAFVIAERLIAVWSNKSTA